MVHLMPLHPQTLSSLASFKSRLILPSWCQLTQVVLEKRSLNGCSISSGILLRLTFVVIFISDVWSYVHVGESRSTTVQLSANKTSYVARQLLESMVYMFSVRARTAVDWGRPTYGNVTVAPRPGKLSRMCRIDNW